MVGFAVKEGITARLGTIEGELEVGRNAKIVAESGHKVLVKGNAHFEGPAILDCDFECQSMRVEGKGWGPGGDVVVRGHLVVHERADIDASVRVDGEIDSEDFDVAGHLRSGSLKSKRVRVGGHMKTQGVLCAETVDVGGHMTVTGEVDLGSLRVGGHVEIGGGRISGEIKVRGHFSAAGKLAFGQMQVYGHLELPAGSSGERLTTLGKVEFEGDASCKVIKIDGVGKVHGNCVAENVEVTGKFDTSGALRVSEKLEVFGTAEAKNGLDCGTLSVGGKLTAESIVSAGEAKVGGQVWTSGGLKAKAIQLGTGSRVNGPIVGETIEIGASVNLGGFWGQMSNLRSIGRMTRVDDVWGKEVRVDRYSQVKRIYADVVRMQGGSVADEIVYTKEIDVPVGVHLARPPKKVEKLPDPPL